MTITSWHEDSSEESRLHRKRLPRSAQVSLNRLTQNQKWSHGLKDRENVCKEINNII